jgi:hypothetical protein
MGGPVGLTARVTIPSLGRRPGLPMACGHRPDVVDGTQRSVPAGPATSERSARLPTPAGHRGLHPLDRLDDNGEFAPRMEPGNDA